MTGYTALGEARATVHYEVIGKDGGYPILVLPGVGFVTLSTLATSGHGGRSDLSW